MQALVFILALLGGRRHDVQCRRDRLRLRLGKDRRPHPQRHPPGHVPAHAALPVGYYRNSSVGDLSARFNADMSQIENGIVLALPMALMGLIEICRHADPDVLRCTR